MLDAQDKEQSDRQSIADVFADFCAASYKAKSPTSQHSASQVQPIPPFEKAELKTGRMELTKGKSKDRSGVDAEMLRHGGEALADAVLAL